MSANVWVCACYLFSSLVNSNVIKYCISCYFCSWNSTEKKIMNKWKSTKYRRIHQVYNGQNVTICRFPFWRISDGYKYCNVSTYRALFSYAVRVQPFADYSNRRKSISVNAEYTCHFQFEFISILNVKSTETLKSRRAESLVHHL